MPKTSSFRCHQAAWRECCKGFIQGEKPDELSFFLNYVKNPIVQEFLPGPEITSDVVTGLDGELLESAPAGELKCGEVR